MEISQNLGWLSYVLSVFLHFIFSHFFFCFFLFLTLSFFVCSVFLCSFTYSLSQFLISFSFSPSPLTTPFALSFLFLFHPSFAFLFPFSRFTSCSLSNTFTFFPLFIFYVSLSSLVFDKSCLMLHKITFFKIVLNMHIIFSILYISSWLCSWLLLWRQVVIKVTRTRTKMIDFYNCFCYGPKIS